MARLPCTGQVHCCQKEGEDAVHKNKKLRILEVADASFRILVFLEISHSKLCMHIIISPTEAAAYFPLTCLIKLNVFSGIGKLPKNTGKLPETTDIIALCCLN